MQLHWVLEMTVGKALYFVRCVPASSSKCMAQENKRFLHAYSKDVCLTSCDVLAAGAPWILHCRLQAKTDSLRCICADSLLHVLVCVVLQVIDYPRQSRKSHYCAYSSTSHVMQHSICLWADDKLSQASSNLHACKDVAIKS